jgi:hypothetical protein
LCCDPPANPPPTATELERQRQIVLSRWVAKLDITRAVIQHRLSLLEAAREMRELIANDSRSLSWLRDCFGGCSDEEMFCRHVIAMVQNDGPLLEPLDVAAEVARLETELQEHLRHGTLHFPNKSPQPILFQIY